MMPQVAALTIYAFGFITGAVFVIALFWQAGE